MSCKNIALLDNQQAFVSVSAMRTASRWFDRWWVLAGHKHYIFALKSLRSSSRPVVAGIGSVWKRALTSCRNRNGSPPQPTLVKCTILTISNKHQRHGTNPSKHPAQKVGTWFTCSEFVACDHSRRSHQLDGTCVGGFESI